MKNSFLKGKFRILTYKEKDTDVYYATALELNLTVSAEDESVALLDLFNQIHEYKESVISIGDKSLLNQEVDPELEKIWNILSGNSKEDLNMVSPYMPISAVTRTSL